MRNWRRRETEIITIILLTGALAPVLARSAETDDRPAASTPPEAHMKIAGYDEGFYLQTTNGRYRLTINGLLQTRLDFDFPEEGQNRARFLVPRARLGFSGHVFNRKFRYGFLTDFSRGSVWLMDYFMDFIMIRKALHLWVGQGKKPFDRQFITSEAYLDFGELSFTVPAFGAARDLGLMFHNDYTRSPGVEWAIGLFNGTGAGPSLNPVFDDDTGELTEVIETNVPLDWRPELVLRLGINGGGIQGYSEGDLEGGPLRWAIGTSWRTRFDGPHDGYVDTAGQLDAVVKFSGLAFVTSGYVLWESWEGSQGFSDMTYKRWGMNNQLSYTLSKKHGLPLRWAFIDPKGGGNNIHELLIGYNLHLKGHQVKFNILGGVILWDEFELTGQRNVVNGLFRAQAQFAF